MAFVPGDTVILQHSGEEGTVVALLDEGMVEVEVDGTRFPVFADQLDYPYFQRFTEMRKTPKKPRLRDGAALPVENKRKKRRAESGMSLSILPVYGSDAEAVVAQLKLYLVNETNRAFTFGCTEYLLEENRFEINSQIDPFAQFYLKDLPFGDLNDRPRYAFRFAPEPPEPELLPAASYTVKLRAKQVLRKLSDLETSGQALFTYPLFSRYPRQADEKHAEWDLPEPAATVAYVQPKAIPYAEQMPDEVDLHIEKLTPEYGHMHPSEMLLLQIAAFQRALENAIQHRQHSLIVIHGIGKGVLKREVHAVLKQTPEVKDFVNQYHARYGFGATEIFFDYFA